MGLFRRLWRGEVKLRQAFWLFAAAAEAAFAFVFFNGHMLKAPQREVVDFTMALATKKAGFEHVVEWFRKHSFKE